MAAVLDEETERWPVLPPLRGELDRIKFQYCAVPLPMYVNDKFIEPVNVNSVADDFGYVCLDKGKRKLVNVVDTFQAQRGDKSRATP